MRLFNLSMSIQEDEQSSRCIIETKLGRFFLFAKLFHDYFLILTKNVLFY